MAVCMRRLASLLIIILFVAVQGRALAAPAKGALASIETLNDKGMAAYRAGKAKEARRQLMTALVIAEDNDLARDRVVATTYLNLGVVNLIGLRQREEAIHCFEQALQIAPALQPPHGVATSRVKSALAEARRHIRRSGRKTEVAAAAPPAPAEESAPVKSKEGVGDVQAAAAPAPQPAPAAPAAGRTLAAARSEDEEAPPNLGPGDAQLSGRMRPGAGHRGPGTIFVGLGIGSALGASPTRQLEAHPNKSVKPGPAFAGLLHVLPEIGVQVSRSLSLSLQSRHQYIRPSGGPDPAVMTSAPKLAHALLACLYYSLHDGETIQWMLTGAVGGGSGFRLKVQPAPQAGVISSDTVAGGPVVFGPGLAMFVHAGRSLVVAPAIRVLAGAPKLAAVAEGSLGLQYAF